MLNLGMKSALDVGNRRYVANGVHFDGSNDWLDNTALTGIADGKVGTLSFWVNPTSLSDVSSQRIMFSQGGRWQVNIVADDDTILVSGDESGGSAILELTSGAALETGNWYHILSSWDLANGLGYMYVNDVSSLAASPTLTDDTIDYTRTEYAIGAHTNGSLPLDGDLAELWWDPTSYIDISVEANRRLFITSGLKPALLGATGAVPTGSQPILYLANATATWQNNLGSGGNFTENGALTDASTSPSD